MPDGQRAVVIPQKDGNFKVMFIRESDRALMSSITSTPQDIASRGMQMMTPEKVFEFQMAQQNAATQRAQAEADAAAKHANAREIAEIRAAGGSTRTPEFIALQDQREKLYPALAEAEARGDKAAVAGLTRRINEITDKLVKTSQDPMAAMMGAIAAQGRLNLDQTKYEAEQAVKDDARSREDSNARGTLAGVTSWVDPATGVRVYQRDGVKLDRTATGQIEAARKHLGWQWQKVPPAK